MPEQHIEYSAAEGEVYRGWLASPGGMLRHPAILVAHEAPGLSDQMRTIAARLADAGYVAFAIDYLGDGALLTTMSEVHQRVESWVSDPAGLRRACAAAHDLLKLRDDVDSSRIGGFGYCFGGQALVEYARTGADLAAIVGFHPGMSVNRAAESRNIRARLLMLLGGDDPITGRDQRTAFEDEMTEAEVNWRMTLYGGVAHSFTNPHADELGMPGIAYNAFADSDSWRTAMRFLADCGLQSDRAG